MELEISNIKSWSNLKLTFEPDIHHILFNGTSGIGKTTILDCIYFALTGECLTNKWCLQYKKKKGYVRLYIAQHNLTILRTLNPKSIEVVIDNTTYTGDKAQNIINSFNYEQFTYIGYLRQKSSYSYFITMTPKNRMSFLEDLLFTDLDLESMKNSIKQEITKIKNEYTRYDEMLSKMNIKPIEPKVTLNQIESEKSHLDILLCKKQELDNIVEKINFKTYKYQELIIQKTEILNDINSYNNEITQYNKLIKYIKPNFDLYKLKITQYEEYSTLHAKYKEWVKNNSNRERNIETKLIQLEELNEQIIEQKHLMKTYSDYIKIKKNIEELNYNEIEYNNFLKEYETRPFIFDKCPNCSISLAANFNGIQRLSLKSEDDLLKSKDIVCYEKEILEFEQKKNNYHILKSILNNLEHRLKYPIWSDDELSFNIKLRDELEKICKNHHKSSVDMNPFDLSNLNYVPITDSEYKDIKYKLKIYNENIIKVEVLERTLSKLNTKLISLEKDISNLESELEKLNIENNTLILMTKDINSHTIQLQTLQDTYEYQETYKKYTNYKSVWNDYTEFFVIFSKTQTDIIMYTLNTINILLKKYLEGFFDFRLEFVFFINHDKNIIDIQMQYKDHAQCDINMLSGGEFDRVVLAVVLSLAEFFKLPILLLDEIMNSLDIYTSEMVLNTIYRCYPENQFIFYVGHNIISGFFDNSIDLDQIV